LIKIPFPCDGCRYLIADVDGENTCHTENPNKCITWLVYQSKLEAYKSQKALDDKEKEEAVKKVFKELRGKMWHSETPYCDREYRITVEDYETILSQMEEE
jgi:hypothetical protein